MQYMLNKVRQPPPAPPQKKLLIVASTESGTVEFAVYRLSAGLTTSPTLGFPGGSLGREGGRGGGGGGVGLTDDGVAGRTGEEEPAEENRWSNKGSNIFPPKNFDNYESFH